MNRSSFLCPSIVIFQQYGWYTGQFARLRSQPSQNMNKTSCHAERWHARQTHCFSVFTRYMAVHPFPRIRSFPRAARPEAHKLASSRVPTEAQLRDRTATNLQDAFYASVPLPPALDRKLEDALRHVLSNPGSMVRPRMVLDLAQAYEVDADAAHDLAIALEYFHTASLIFDDMPCMDDATERRGKSCLHVEFGDATAILSALALINRAYALIWRSIAASPRENQLDLMTYVEQRLGIDGLLNGQSLDLNYSALPHTRESTEIIALGKTVSLIRLTLVLPAMLGRAPQREVQLLERIAVCWGLGYQIIDDLKDVLQTTNETGKTAARDELLGRPNIASAIGICPAVERLERLMYIGDLTLKRLLAHRPSLLFLGRLRRDLDTELRRVTDSACEIAEEATTRERA